MNIIFRVDSSKEIGAGHSMRCYALAEEFLRNNHKVIFISNSQLDFVKEKLLSKNIIIEKIKKTAPLEEIEIVIKLLEKYKSNFLILDGYKFDYEYQKKLKAANTKIVYITDLKGKYHCDVLICPTPGLKPKDFESEIETKYLLGPKYVLLRDEILNLKPKTKYRNQIKQILVSFGASFFDEDCYKKIIDLIEYNYKNCFVNFLAGSEENAKRIKKLLTEEKNKYEILLPKDVNSKLYSKIDLAFTTASTTMWELLYLKIPIVCFYTTDNQKGNAEWLGRNKYAINLGDIRNKIKNIKIIQKNKININFKTKGEIYFQILQLLSNIKFYKGTIKDCKFIWELRNSENIRKWSFNREYIPYSKHKIWYKEKINNKDTIYYILLKDNKKIGYIRYDINQKGEAETNIAINENYQGQNIGSILLILTQIHFKKNNRIKKIIAKIKRENKASIRCFEKAGYKKIKSNQPKIIIMNI